MNQILVTKKLYVTPELKKKKKVYKIDFLLSVFLVFVLLGACIYENYARNKSEEVSQEILESFNEDETTAKSDVLVVVLSDDAQTIEEINNNPSNTLTNTPGSEVVTTSEGFRYTTIATINIPKLGLEYPILDGETDSVEETEALLKMAPTKFHGPQPNKVGNFCIVGHNYRNSKFFSKVPTLENGDIINITDTNGKMIQYKIYDKYEVVPEDVSCTSQLTDGKKEITLITCTNDSKLRVVVKASAV